MPDQSSSNHGNEQKVGINSRRLSSNMQCHKYIINPAHVPKPKKSHNKRKNSIMINVQRRSHSTYLTCSRKGVNHLSYFCCCEWKSKSNTWVQDKLRMWFHLNKGKLFIKRKKSSASNKPMHANQRGRRIQRAILRIRKIGIWVWH